MAKGGPCGIWAMKDGDYEAHVFEGTSAGLTAALAYVGSNGVVHVYPGSSTVTIPTIAAGVRLTKHEAGVETIYGPSTTEYDRTGKRKNQVYNVLDYADVATAIAAVPVGGKLYFPSAGGPYTPPDANGWSITKGIEIFSDGTAIGEDKGFQYFNSAGAANGNSVVFNISSAARGVHLHDFMISNNAGKPAAGGTGDAIRFDSATGVLQNLRIERVHIHYAGRNAIRLNGTDYGVLISIRDSVLYGCRGPGFFATLCNVLVLDNVNSTINSASKLAAELHGSAFTFVNCSEVTMNACTGESCGEGLTNGNYDAYVYLENCGNANLSGLHIEDIGEAAIRNGIVLNSCRSVVVAGCNIAFPDGAANVGSKGIHLANATKGCTILTNTYGYIDRAVEINDATLDLGNTILPQNVSASSANSPGRVVIPAGGKNFAFVNNLTAGVSDNKGVGFLLPSMAHTSAVSSAVVQDGLVVYDSTNAQMRFRIGGAWYSAVVSAT